MSLLATLRVALANLLAHKSRSILTCLGIILGISAIVTLVSAGQGVEEKLDERLQTVGQNMIIIRSGGRTQSGEVVDLAPLKREDAAAIRHRVGPLLTGVAEVQLAHRVVATGTGQWSTLVSGSTPELKTLRGWQLAAGRFYDDDELKRGAAVAVIGQTVQQKLFPEGTNPVGQLLRIDRLHVRIVGVLHPKGRFPMGPDQDDEVFLPITTLQQRVVGEDKIHMIIAAGRSRATTERAMEEIGRVLRDRHHLAAGAEDFEIRSVQEMADLAFTMTSSLQMLVAIVASLSLLVGGIGVMNIMLVAVTERTREIGIRLAIGGTPASVLGQFLAEAVIVSLLGGVLGVGLGLAATGVIAQLAGWPLVFSPAAVLFAFLLTAGLGVCFGFYPAWKASRLDPIQALRFE